MSGRLLIVDAMSTNRIVLRVKLLAAKYDVEAVASCEAADAAIARRMPDLILINLFDGTDDSLAFCARVRRAAATRNIPIISVGGQDTSAARFSALDAGADDVLPRPICDTLLMARVRNLLRRGNRARELDMRSETLRMMGLDDAAGPRIAPACVTLLSDSGIAIASIGGMLQSGLRQRIRTMGIDGVLSDHGQPVSPDVFVIDARSHCDAGDDLFRLLADLRTRDTTRHAAQLILLPANDLRTAALVLDLGADDVILGAFEGDELCHRTRALVAHKLHRDRLMDQVNTGLAAAMTDPLTGLFNRRYALAHLHRIAEQACESGCNYALMVADIDHFKSVNDTYGHSVGDRVLMGVGACLRDSFRPDDLVARIGGEEFLIVMPRTSVEDATVAAQRLREMIGAKPFDANGDRPALHVTISVGIAAGSAAMPTGGTLDALFDRADVALYRAKAEGRNAVAVDLSAA
ncbi:diguanylate cyclase [Loktanella sp. SALINAS62]|uniref:diguanylate cyclase n=1 Tax=Loktanella sp. SALINAS62 TaxID=2706124 RepID=UPI001B8D006E|nr:diguanylate cyclase [Loktanella sp. SALINAS62]MBS1304022.1 diguanylate cyclase [Loktanella sp. SALINAS62]